MTDDNTIPAELLPEGFIPEDLTAEYRNDEVRTTLDTLTSQPDYDRLSEFLRALRGGYLVVDVTGTDAGGGADGFARASGKRASKRSEERNAKRNAKRAAGHRIRTTRSTQGQLVLPIFTSMDELRQAVPPKQQDAVKGAVMPALEALALIRTDAFVAAQFDAGTAQFVVLRKFIERVLDETDPLEAASFERA